MRKVVNLTADNCIYYKIPTQDKIEVSKNILEAMKFWKEVFPNVNIPPTGKEIKIRGRYIG